MVDESLKSKCRSSLLSLDEKNMQCSREGEKESFNASCIIVNDSRRFRSASEGSSSRPGLVSSCHPCQTLCS